MSAHNIFIFGSCVSRDTARLSSDRFHVVDYIARQSWISAMSSPTVLPKSNSGLKSDFQRRMIEYDIQSQLTASLSERAGHTDLVLLDLVDERTGVMPTSHGYFTYSIDFQKSAWRDEISTKLVSFGTDEHFHLWQSAADQLKSLLDRVNLFSKAHLIRADFADATISGRQMGKTLGFSSAHWNRQYERYYGSSRTRV